jgi:hypothetical protein
VDGTLVPTHDRSVSTSSKNDRYSVTIQVVLDANPRLTVAVGRPTPATATTAGPTATLGPTGNAVAPS